MAKNDKILIDGIIDERVENKIPSDKRDEVFEYFAFEQILKDYDLSHDELISGSVDGRNDGGIDGFYIFINGHLLVDLSKFNWPKTGSILEIWIITCKHHETFKQAPLDNLVASLTELFDLSIENNDLKGDYSDTVLNQRTNFKTAYRKVSPRLSKFKVNFCYASRGNTEELGESIVARANQVEQITNDSFGNCSAKFNFLGSTELIELNRKMPNFTLELPFTEDLSSGQTYILLVKLKDYFQFITDEYGKLRRYLFDSNVRDYMGLNRVNEDIKNTLANENSTDFWWLNNGITILSTGASVIGKSIMIQDIQIVNGLQTSESIFRHFVSGGSDQNSRSVLVKVIVSINNAVRDEIIRATNNQTIVELASLHATDKIQRDIEEVLKLNGFYYERRTNYYKNQGIPIDKILTPLYAASGYVNLILKSPDQASNIKAKFMRNANSYEKVFSADVDLSVWPKIVYILKFTDNFLETKRPNSNSISEHFLKYRRQYLSFLTVSRIIGKFSFSTRDIILLDLSKYTFDELEKTWDILKNVISNQFNKARITRSVFLDMCQKASEIDNINDFERLNYNFGINPTTLNNNSNYRKPKEITPEFIEKIKALLPEKPWNRDIFKNIEKELNCTSKDIYRALKQIKKQRNHSNIKTTL